jgi:hypothetical protein
MQVLQGLFEMPVAKFASVDEAVTQLAKLEADIASEKLDANDPHVIDYKHLCNIVINRPDTTHPALPFYPKYKD